MCRAAQAYSNELSEANSAQFQLRQRGHTGTARVEPVPEHSLHEQFGSEHNVGSVARIVNVRFSEQILTSPQLKKIVRVRLHRLSQQFRTGQVARQFEPDTTMSRLHQSTRLELTNSRRTDFHCIQLKQGQGGWLYFFSLCFLGSVFRAPVFAQVALFSLLCFRCFGCFPVALFVSCLRW